MLRCIIFALLMVAVAARASAGLGELTTVDRVIIEKATGQPTLVLLLDRPLEEDQTVVLARQKLAHYAAFVENGQLYSEFPSAKRSAPVQVLVFYLPSRTPKAQSALQQISAYSRQFKLKPLLRSLI